MYFPCSTLVAPPKSRTSVHRTASNLAMGSGRGEKLKRARVEEVLPELFVVRVFASLRCFKEAVKRVTDRSG